MKMNPVYKRETTVSSRSFRLALIIMVFNGILALVALLNMYSVVARVKITAEIQYSSFLNLYVFVSVVAASVETEGDYDTANAERRHASAESGSGRRWI